MNIICIMMFLWIICVVAVTGIYIPLGKGTNRCMIVYSVGESETMKLEINFPPIPDQLPDERFLVEIKNTESNEVSVEEVQAGKFRKELDLAISMFACSIDVIYEVCLSVLAGRDFGQLHVQYVSTNVFSLNQAEVKVP